MRILTVIAGLAIIILGVTFAFLNSEVVHVNYYLGSSELPLSMLLIGVLVIGAFLGAMLSLMPLLRAKFANMRLRKKLAQIEKEALQLKNLASSKG